jgi:hypothetical protein
MTSALRNPRALVARVYFLQGKDYCIVFFGPRYLLFFSPGHTTPVLSLTRRFSVGLEPRPPSTVSYMYNSFR